MLKKSKMVYEIPLGSEIEFGQYIVNSNQPYLPSGIRTDNASNTKFKEMWGSYTIGTISTTRGYRGNTFSRHFSNSYSYSIIQKTVSSIAHGYRPVLVKVNTSGIKYEGLIELGSLAINGKVVPKPTNPWTKDVNINGDIGNIHLISNGTPFDIWDTTDNTLNNLSWHKFDNNGKIILVADRNILTGMSVNDFVTGPYGHPKEIVIDGLSYILRSIDLGYSTDNDNTSIYPLANEWDLYVNNSTNIANGPSYNEYHCNNMMTMDMSKLCIDHTKAITRGGAESNKIIQGSANDKTFGFRPVLELISPAKITYNGSVRKGTLYMNNTFVNPPTNTASPSYITNSTIEIRNTDSNVIENNIQWEKYTEGTTELLISSKILFNKVSINQLLEMNLAYGKEITIDGENYILRNIDCGSAYNLSPMFTITVPSTFNEFDKYINNTYSLAIKPIKWQLVDIGIDINGKNEAILISRDIVDTVPFDAKEPTNTNNEFKLYGKIKLLTI
jgi:hypothetical protein